MLDSEMYMNHFLKKHGQIIKYIVLFATAMLVTWFIPRLLLPASVLNDESSALDILSLQVSLFSLCVSVIISVLVFDLGNQRNESEKKNKQILADRLMLAAIDNGLRNLTTDPDYRQFNEAKFIRNYFDDYREQYAVGLSAHSYDLLSNVVIVIDKLADDKLNSLEDAVYTADIFPSWIEKIRNSSFLEYMAYADYHDLLPDRMIRLLNELDAGLKKHVNPDQRDVEIYGYFKNSKFILFKKNDDKISIKNHHGDIVADGIFGLNEKWNGQDNEPLYIITDGYSVTENYEGYLKNGRYDGEGKTLNEYNESVEEGRWKNGKLIDGIIHDCIVQFPDGYSSASYTDSQTGKRFNLFRPYDEIRKENKDSIIDILLITAEKLDQYYVTDVRRKRMNMQ